MILRSLLTTMVGCTVISGVFAPEPLMVPVIETDPVRTKAVAGVGTEAAAPPVTLVLGAAVPPNIVEVPLDGENVAPRLFGILAGRFPLLIVSFSFPPVAPRDAVAPKKLEVNREAAEPPIASAPAATRPRRSGTLKVVLPSPTPNVVLTIAK